MIDEKVLSYFLESLIINEKVMRELNSRTADYYNLVEVTGPGENNISNIIASLLDPDGTHGQGIKLLKLFIERINEILGKKKFVFSHDQLRQARVYREYVIKNDRRIDILVEFPGGVYIGIENKLWAGEQKDQIGDYYDFLKRHSRDFLLIYLDLLSRKAVSIDEKIKSRIIGVQLIETDYFNLILPWLSQILGIGIPEKLKFYIQDFYNWIQWHFYHGGGSMDRRVEYELIKNFLLDDSKLNKSEKLIMAFTMCENFEEICKEIHRRNVMEPLQKKLKNLFKDKNYKYEAKEDDEGINITHPDWKGKLFLRLGRSFEKCEHSDTWLFFALQGNSEGELKNISEVKKIFSILEQYYTDAKPWGIFQVSLLHMPFRDYFEKMITMPDELVDIYFEKVGEFIDRIENHNIKALIVGIVNKLP